MSNLKRNFAAFQADTKFSLPPSTTTGLKKLKMSMESNIKVFTRFRPIFGETYSGIHLYFYHLKVLDVYQLNIIDNSITINKPEEVIIKNGGIKKFFFSDVFDPETTQEEVMRQACFPLIEDLFNYNKSGLLFTYGVTNAGKTHTIIGTKADPGILPRSIKTLLTACDKIMTNLNSNNTEASLFADDQIDIKLENVLNLPNHPEYKLADLKVCLEAFEIYNEEIYDLLPDTRREKISGALIRPKLQMKEKDNRRVYIKDLTSIQISSGTQIETILDKCIANRSQADTVLNSNSSRSHTIFKIVLKYTYQSSANNVSYDSSLCIVDLAGSERAKRTENTGNQMLEACNINKSLLVLGRCLKSLKDNQMSLSSTNVVPYRDSKLTKILFEYFHEENNLRMIANINPRQADFEESMRVLNYAAIAKDIQPIKSRVDSSRRMLFPLGASKDVSRSRTEDNLSVLSTDDSLLNFKGLFDDKENIINNLDNIDTASKKSVTPSPRLDEKDIKIKVLEDIVIKIQERMYVKDMNDKLTSVNESFKHSMRYYLANERNSESRSMNSFAIEPVNISNNQDHPPYFLQNSFTDMQSFFPQDMKPLNVNYFIFQGSNQEKSFNGLQKAFSINNSDIRLRDHSLTPETVRNDNKEAIGPENIKLEEKPEVSKFDDFEPKNEADDNDILNESPKGEAPLTQDPKPKNEPKKRGRKKKNEKKEKRDHKTHSPNLKDLTGYEHLATPELIKLTVQIDKNSDEANIDEKKEEIPSFPAEEINFEEVKNDPAPIANRTRARRNKK